jgi:hypothetical protein
VISPLCGPPGAGNGAVLASLSEKSLSDQEVAVEVLALRWLLVATACLVGAIGAVVAQAALAADPPIVSVGPVSDPTGAVTGSGARTPTASALRLASVRLNPSSAAG